MNGLAVFGGLREGTRRVGGGVGGFTLISFFLEFFFNVAYLNGDHPYEDVPKKMAIITEKI
jgi:hypothetical protein